MATVAAVESAPDPLKQTAAALAPRDMSDLEFYRSVIESLAEGVLITDAQWRILYANRVMQELSGCALHELIGRTPLELFAVDAEEQARCDDKDPLAENEESMEMRLKTKSGELRWVLLKATPFRNCQDEIVGRVAALSCIARQKTLELENEILLTEVRENFGHIVGESLALKKVLSQIATVAPTEASVLVLGESGTGKELVARAVHELSARKSRPLVRVNCASIPKELFESEFFGHVRGAFTGAIKDRAGRFELADGGTLFLDEIGEIPPELQSKLLRVLQEGQFERVGDERTRRVDVRIIAATNRDLLAEAKAGRFRLDLYYRLSVFPIELPPLRERREDLAPLALHFIGQAARRLGTPRPRLTKAHLRELESYDWPGNVRELQNVLERAVILARGAGGRLQFELPSRIRQAGGSPLLGGTASASSAPGSPGATLHGSPEAGDDGALSFDELAQRERQIVLTALQRRNWKVFGADGAAALLNVKPTTLISKMKRLRIDRPPRAVAG